MKTPTVADRSAAVEMMQKDWAVAAALMGGTSEMRANYNVFMHQGIMETADAFAKRVAMATLYPAYQRTVETLSSKPFAKAVVRNEDIPAKIVPWLDDVDLEGRNIDTFAYELIKGALGFGLSGILIDYPRKADELPRSVAQEKAAGLRPYWIHIRAQQILGWRARRENGKWIIEQLRLMESVSIDDGEWAEKTIEQVRVLTPGAWRTYRKDEKNEWQLFESGTTTLSYVPFVACYGDRTGFLTARPPLIEMGHLNVKHWQSQSMQDHLLNVARAPILTARQVGDRFELKIGAAAAVDLGDSPNAELRYVEHTGAAIDAGKISLDDLQEQMRQAGAELLLLQPGSITATQVRTEDSVSMCALQRLTKGGQDCIDQALQITAEWTGEADGGGVTLFTDFGALTMDAASASLIAGAQTSGLISKQTAIGELKRRGILSAEVEADEEAELIAGEGPALGAIGDDGEPVITGGNPVTGVNPGQSGTNTPSGTGSTPTGTGLQVVNPPAPQDLQQIPNQPAAPSLPDFSAIFSELANSIRAGLQPRETAPLTAETVSQPPFDLTPLVAAMERFQQPAPLDINALLTAIGNIQYSITINQAPVNVEGATVNVDGPTVTVQPPAVTVGAPVINMPAPPPRNREATFKTDGNGDITGASLEP